MWGRHSNRQEQELAGDVHTQEEKGIGKGLAKKPSKPMRSNARPSAPTSELTNSPPNQNQVSPTPIQTHPQSPQVPFPIICSYIRWESRGALGTEHRLSPLPLTHLSNSLISHSLDVLFSRMQAQKLIAQNGCHICSHPELSLTCFLRRTWYHAMPTAFTHVCINKRYTHVYTYLHEHIYIHTYTHRQAFTILWETER